jgi:cobalamin biosynthesis protein CobT
MTMALEQALRAITRCRKEPFLRSGRLDNDRLVEIAKNLSKNIFYQKRQGRELSTAVSLVIDQSGSMGCIGKIRNLVILLGECLYRLGIPFEIIGSTTKCSHSGAPELDGFDRTNPIIYDHYKSFNDQWPIARERLLQMGAFVHNIDGEVVEFAARQLLTRTEDRKIIFSLCDGEPCGGQDNDEKLGKNITRVANLARKSGVEVFGVGLGCKGPGVFYGEDHFIFLESGNDIGEQFVREFAKILTKGQVRI